MAIIECMTRWLYDVSCLLRLDNSKEASRGSNKSPILIDMYYGYARVSTDSQNHTSIETQLNFLKVQAKLLREPFVPMEEVGSGITIENRPIFSNLLSIVKDGDIIGVYDQSRLGRNTEDSLSLIKNLGSLGVRVQVDGKFIDYSNPQDKLIYTVQSSFSTYQLDIQRQKSLEGIKQARINGDYINNGNLFGYDIMKVKGKTVATINEDASRIIKFIYEEYLRGTPLLKLTGKLRELYTPSSSFNFNRSSIWRLLQRPLYMGYYLAETRGWFNIHSVSRETLKSMLVKSNIYPPIIDEQLWWAVYDNWRPVVRSKDVQVQYRWSQNECSSLYRCKYCNAGYVTDTVKKKDGSIIQKLTCQVHADNCQSPYYRGFYNSIMNFITRAMVIITFSYGSEINEFFTKQQNILIQSKSEKQAQISNIEAEISSLEKKKSKLIDLIADTDLDPKTFTKKIKEIDDKKNSLLEKKQSINSIIQETDIEAEMLLEELSEDFVDRLIQSDAVTRREMYRKAITSATIDEQFIDVNFIHGKHFNIRLYPRKSKTNKNMTFKMYHNNTFQGSGLFDVNSYEVKFDHDPAIYWFLQKLEKKVNFILKQFD